MKPENVHSPRSRWQLIAVLLSGREESGSDSLALGLWDKVPALAARWNGEPDSKGNPVSTGQATWFILPEWYWPHLLSDPRIPAEKRAMAEAILPKR